MGANYSIMQTIIASGNFTDPGADFVEPAEGWVAKVFGELDPIQGCFTSRLAGSRTLRQRGSLSPKENHRRVMFASALLPNQILTLIMALQIVPLQRWVS